ncbi:MAG TPA: methyltransferase domain-containing protein [Terriglobales bacterium]|nr:methyltransferase domain-containing protein [Terriglobales bacterium]
MTSFQSRLRSLKSRVFLARGRRPFARGYISYRQILLEEYVHKTLPDQALPENWGLWLDERVVEYPWFLSRLPQTAGRLLDAGSILNHEYVLSHQKLQNKQISIFTLAPEDESHCDRGISYVYGDLRDCCFRDEYFDCVACLSTLEHVGLDNTRHYTRDSSKNECSPESYVRALLEMRRVLKTGGTLFLSMPCGRAANLGWLQVFDQTKIKTLLEIFAPKLCREIYFRYTDSGWQYSSLAACADAGYCDAAQRHAGEPAFAAAEAVVCLELTK